MKARFIIFTLLGTLVALGIGWFFDSQKELTTENTLEVPDNVDYYLSNVKYLALNDQGDARFRLETPYLEHFIREDTSQLSQPSMEYQLPSGNWTLKARSGSFQHGKEIFHFHNEASIRRTSTDPFVLNSEQFIFEAQTERLTVPQKLKIISPTLNLDAHSAILDMKTSTYRFKRVMAVYENRNNNEPG